MQVSSSLFCPLLALHSQPRKCASFIDLRRLESIISGYLLDSVRWFFGDLLHQYPRTALICTVLRKQQWNTNLLYCDDTDSISQPFYYILMLRSILLQKLQDDAVDAGELPSSVDETKYASLSLTELKSYIAEIEAEEGVVVFDCHSKLKKIVDLLGS